MGTTLRGPASGSFFGGHDAKYCWARQMGGPSLAGGDGDPASVPRWLLSGSSVSEAGGEFPIDHLWQKVAFRFWWDKEAAGNGTVKLKLRYRNHYPLVNTGYFEGDTMTEITIPDITVDSYPVNRGIYSVPTITSAIPVPPDGFLSSAPIMVWSLQRDGVSDTYSGDIGIAGGTVTRVD